LLYFSEKLSTGYRQFVEKVKANIRTYAQLVDNLCVSCDKTIYCG